MAITIEELEKLRDSGVITSEVFEKLARSSEMASDAIVGVGVASKEAAQNIGEFLGVGKFNAEQLEIAYGKVQEKVLSYASKAGQVNRETNGAIMKSATVLGTMLAPQITEGTKAFGEFGKIGAASSMNVSDSMSNIINKLPRGVQEMIRLSESAQGARAGLYSLMQQSGDIGPLMQNLGDGTQSSAVSLDLLDQATTSMSKRMEELGRKAMLPTPEVLKLVEAYGKMPGMLNAVTDASAGAGDRMDAMVQTVMLARGLGLDHSEVIKRQTDSLYKWGTSINKTNENLVFMNKAIQETGVHKDIMTSFLDSATQGTNKLKDSTESAIIVMSTLGKVLKDNGMGAQGVGEMLSGSMQRMGNLDMGKAAFISQQSGGPSGLAGAFDIERMKQEGDLGGILSKATDAFKNMGVEQIVTLDDVKENESLAGELMKQTEFLKTLGVAGDTTEATKMLEAMKSGAFEELAKSMEDPAKRQIKLQEAQKELLISGNDISAGMANSLLALQGKQEELSRANALTLQGASNDMDSALGIERERGAEGINAMSGDITGIGSSNAVNTMTGKKEMGTLETQNPETFALETYARTIESAKDGADKLKDGIKGAMSDMNIADIYKDNIDGIKKSMSSMNASDIYKDTINGMESPLRSSGETTGRAIDGASRGTQSAQGTGGAQELNGKINVILTLTDEERNLFVKREFVEEIVNQANKRTPKEPSPFSGG